jgi:methionyl-tRNA formyltransferase
VKVWRAHEAASEEGAATEIGVISAGASLHTGDGDLVLDEVQPEGKRVMTGAAWRAGLRGDGRVDPA